VDGPETPRGRALRPRTLSELPSISPVLGSPPTYSPALQCTSCRQPWASFSGVTPKYSFIFSFHTRGTWVRGRETVQGVIVCF
jgi:hypothetical protein